MRDLSTRWRRSLVIVGLIFSTATLPHVLEGAAATKAKSGGRKAVLAGAQSGEWWKVVDTGPFQADTILTRNGGDVAALKGLAIKLGSAGNASVVFDTELLAMRAGFEGAIELDGTAWNGNNQTNSHYPSGPNAFFFRCGAGLGWAINGDWTDPRPLKAGPLPKEVGRYRGLFRHGRQTVLHYTVGGVRVLELPWLETVKGVRALTRTFNLDASNANLELLVSERAAGEAATDTPTFLVGAPPGVTLKTSGTGRTTVQIAKGAGASRFTLVYAERAVDPAAFSPPIDLTALTRGGPPIFPETIAVKGQLDPAAASKTYAVDVIPLPTENPWKASVRSGAFDFFADGRRAACATWNGDVWIADGIDGDLSRVTWRRFASGLFQTLGLKIVHDVIYTQGRDQLTRLHDLNGDGEADHYECFNNDVQITAGFHEFSFDLQTDRAGNFYFSKAMPVLQGGRGFGPATPHNGTVMKVSPDGSRLEVVARGLRAPGGLGVSPDGIITTGENEGSFVPACKITWTKPGAQTFNGVVPGKWDSRSFLGPLPGAPTDYDRPLCWLPYYADNSSGSQAWVPAETKWDPRHAGELLHLSYGKSSIFRVLREEVNGQVQGGVYRLPIDVSAAVMRARFHPLNGQLYTIGFRGWQTNGRDAFQRIRYTGTTIPQPVGLHAHRNGLLIRFSAPLDPKTAGDRQRYSISKWNYVWGPQYGSGRFSIDHPDLEAEAKALTIPSKGAHNIIDTVMVAAAKLVEDGRAVFLYLPKMTSAMQMELKLDLLDARGAIVRDTIYHTVHALNSDFTVPGVRWEDIPVAAAEPVGEPGLIMSFGGVTTDAVRVERLAMNTPAGTSPTVFTTPREFETTWQGMLVVPERDEFTFSFEGVGTVSLQIGGRVIVSGELPLTARVPLTLAKGPHPIFCSYRSRENGEGRVRFMWSSPQFRTEPVPASAFRMIPSGEVEAWSKARLGRQVFAAAQCIRCHQPRTPFGNEAMPELSASVPDFKNIGHRLERAWLEKWISAPQGHCPTLAPNEAADIAAHLSAVRDPAWQGIPLTTDAASVAEGGRLVERLMLGHWIEPLTKTAKHTAAGLVDHLLHPARHHPDTVFPDLHLTRAEATQIAAYIRSMQPGFGMIPTGGNRMTGEAIVAKSCVACHDAGSRPASTITAPSFDEIAFRDWTVRGCLSPNRGRAPDLHLQSDDIAALIALRNADRDVGIQSLRRFVPAEYAARQMAALNCTECHRGRDKVPDLAQIGDKLDRDWIMKLIAGGHPTKTRPWLEARMPAFASRADKLSLGIAALHGVPFENEAPAAHPDLVPLGEKLTGPEGYSCITCHDAGSRKALQIFEGQGPNLRLAAERLRYDHFQRWMHFPQRFAPATIMPRYTKDRDHAITDTPFDGNAEQQFEAVWQWMKNLGAKN